MRRIDTIVIGLGLLVAGPVIYGLLQAIGMEAQPAGIWTQALLVFGLILWLLSYLFRAATKTMTYNQQLQDYEDAVLQKRLDELTPDQLAQLQQELAAETEATEAVDPDATVVSAETES